MHEIASVIIEKIKANLSMSGTFGESSLYFRASFPRKQIVGQGSRSMSEVIFALTKRSTDATMGGGGKWRYHADLGY